MRYRLPGGATWSQVEVGDDLPAGSRIVTDAAGKLTIERSGETIIMRPSARLMLPAAYRAHSARQEAGGLSYHIERSRDRRFEVETPYAALVVKGTAFDVEVTGTGVAISVERGLVGVTSRGGAAANLGAGHAAKVSASPGHALEVRQGLDAPYVPVEPANLSWFDRFLEGVQSASHPRSDSDAGGGGTGGASAGGSGRGGASVGGGGGGLGGSASASVGGASVGGGSVGGASVASGGVSVGGASIGGVSVGGASIGSGGVSVGGASVGGASVGPGGVSVGGVSAGGLSVGCTSLGRGGLSVGGFDFGGRR